MGVREDELFTIWASSTKEEQIETKSEIIDALCKRTGLSKEDINKFVAQWAYSSNDDDMRSLAIQKDAAELFAVPLSKFTQEKIEMLLQEPAFKREYGELPRRLRSLLPSNQQKAILQAMYNNTQDRLAKAGFRPGDMIRLRRGVTHIEASLVGREEGSVVNIIGNTLESWTVGVYTADWFAGSDGAVFEMDVPIELVVGSARTGFGCLKEGEFVVLGSMPGKAKLLRLYAE